MTVTSSAATMPKMRQGELTAMPEIDVVRDPQRIRKVYLDLLGQARKEIMMLLPSANSFHRQERLGVIDSLKLAAGRRRLSVRILTATDPVVEKRIAELDAKKKKSILFQRIAPATKEQSAMIVVVDRKVSFIIEKEDDTQEDFVDAADVATYSTGEATIKTTILFFETLWNVNELLETEARTRSEAQSNPMVTSEVWEITAANYKCAGCGRLVAKEIRIHDPRLMSAQSKAASSAMEVNAAGWIPFCFSCISTHPYLKPAWLIRGT